MPTPVVPLRSSYLLLLQYLRQLLVVLVAEVEQLPQQVRALLRRRLTEALERLRQNVEYKLLNANRITRPSHIF